MPPVPNLPPLPSAPPVPPVLRVGARDLVVVAGLPGSGKSRLLRRIRACGRFRAVDPEQVAGVTERALATLAVRVPYRVYRPLVHTAHWLRVVAFALGSRDVVLVHATGTRPSQLALVRVLSWLTRRPRRYVWLDVPPEVAYASTHLRGRPHRPDEFARHVRRATRTSLAARPDAVVVDRAWVDAAPLLVVGPRERA